MGWKRRLSVWARSATGLVVSDAGGLYHHVEVESLRRFFREMKIDCVFDVGANEGQYATRLRKEVGYRGAIVSFEPVPEVAERLRATAESDPNWFVEEKALTDKPGTATLNVMTDSQFSSIESPSDVQLDTVRDMNTVERSMGVRCSTVDIEIDHYRRRIGFRRPFLKMDTQGHDLQVFAGASGSLKEIVGLQSELAFKALYKNAPLAEESLSVYRGAGFKLTALVPNNGGHFPDLLEMDCLMYRGDAFA